MRGSTRRIRLDRGAFGPRELLGSRRVSEASGTRPLLRAREQRRPMNRRLRLILLSILGIECLARATEGVSLRWSDVRLSIPDKRSKKKGARRDIIKDCYGQAQPGRLLGIMGPSGSGKTSLLLALAGQVEETKGMDLEGRVAVNGERVKNGIGSSQSVRAAFLKQESLFYAQMTVRETLMFAARLRLPREMPLEEKRELVESLLRKLELLPSADTPVGDERTRGISGGEKKRLSIACELLSDPQILFFDEPTSGLDSFQAERVVHSLRQLAREGRTVVCVIHQPSGKVFSMFDDLVLLSPQGEPAYVGSVNRMAAYFASLGYHCPRVVSPGEFAVNLVSIDRETPELEQRSVHRIEKILSADRGRYDRSTYIVADDNHDEQKVPGSELVTAKEGKRLRASTLEQYKLLFERAISEVTRAKLPFFIKTMQQLSTAIIYGGIYKLSDSQKSIQDRFGLLSLVAIGTTNIGIASTVRSFPKEKAIFKDEQSKKIYGVFPYFLSKVIADIPVSTFLSCLFGAIIYPLTGLQRNLSKFLKFLGLNVLHSVTSSAIGLFLGAASPSVEAAVASFPPVLILMIIFNGFNISQETTPRFLRWVPNVSIIRWAFEGFSINEMKGMKFSCKNFKGPCCQTGEEALSRIGIDLDSATVESTKGRPEDDASRQSMLDKLKRLQKPSFSRAVAAECAILLASYLLTLRSLGMVDQQYAQMQLPSQLK